nr:class I SAM-dependent methyltransferase [uncultured Moraxella sp.]
MSQDKFIIYADKNAKILKQLIDFFHKNNFAVEILEISQKINQKWLKSAHNGSLLIDNDELFLIADGMKVNPNWQSLTNRIVKAGKKTENLLKIAKLQNDMQVIDCTAGFGHDSLILASTGASVAMIEQNPLMFLLLQCEYQKQLNNPNWQKLLGRISLNFGKSVDILPTLPKADVIYLDPMFPQDSYKSAVGKTMQILHFIENPPSFDDEMGLLNSAKNGLKTNGRVIVKRPKSAPFLANLTPIDSLTNDVVRFDVY